MKEAPINMLLAPQSFLGETRQQPLKLHAHDESSCTRRSVTAIHVQIPCGEQAARNRNKE